LEGDVGAGERAARSRRCSGGWLRPALAYQARQRGPFASVADHQQIRLRIHGRSRVACRTRRVLRGEHGELFERCRFAMLEPV